MKKTAAIRKAIWSVLILMASVSLTGFGASDGTLTPESTDQSINIGDPWNPAHWVDGIVAEGAGSLMTVNPKTGGTGLTGENGASHTIGSLKVVNSSALILNGAEPLVFSNSVHSLVGNASEWWSEGRFESYCPLEFLSPVTVCGYGGFFPYGDVNFHSALDIGRHMFFRSPANVSRTIPKLWGQGALGIEQESGFYTCVSNPATFGGSVYLKKGTLKLVGGDPLLNDGVVSAELPTAGLLCRMDASDRSSMTFSDDERIEEWRDVSGNGHRAVPREGVPAPVLEEGMLGEKPAVMFSVATKDAGRSYNSSMQFESNLTGVKSVVWVVGGMYGGGSLLGNADAENVSIVRGTAYSGFGEDSLGERNMTPILNRELCEGNKAAFWRNGERIDPFSTGLTGGFDILVMSGADIQPAFKYLAYCPRRGMDGGQALAEILMYDHELSESERTDVQRYLYRKWKHGRCDVGRLHVFGVGGTVEVVAPANDSNYEMTIEHLEGSGELEKTGNGSLKIDDPQSFPGTIRLTEGTLVLGTPETQPFTGEPCIAEGAIAHYDASDASTLTIRDGRVQQWRDLVNPDHHADARWPTNLEQGDGQYCQAPLYRADAMNGRPTVDCGVVGKNAFMMFNTAYTGIKTFFLAGDARYGGGFFFSKYEPAPTGMLLHRAYTSPIGSSVIDYDTEFGFTYDEFAYRWRLNGRHVGGRSQGFTGGGDIVSAIRFPHKDDASELMAVTSLSVGNERPFSRWGGMQYGEILFYDRDLTESEIRATEAYLRNKWIGSRPALRGLTVNGDVRIKTDSDVTIESVGGTGRLVKIGAGTLTIKTLALDFDGKIEAAEGKVVFLDRQQEAPTSPSALADAIVHLDAADAATVTTDAGKVVEWRDKKGLWNLASGEGSRPDYVRDDSLNGAYVDLGWPGDGKLIGGQETVTNVRTVAMVYSGAKGGRLFYSPGFSWDRNPGSTGDPVFTTYAERGLWRADTWLDGLKVSPVVQSFNRKWQTVTFVTGEEASARGLGASETEGGGLYAEVIMWNRALTAGEREEVEAYLASKWMAKSLHGFHAPGKPTIEGVDVMTTNVMDVAASTTTSVGWVVGAGTFVKTGAGTLEVAGSTTGFTGGFSVKEGTLRLTASSTVSQTLPVTDGLLANFDASETTSVVLDEEGKVSLWRDLTGTYDAKPILDSTPDYLEADCNGLNTVDLGWHGEAPERGSDPIGSALHFVKNGSYVEIENVRTVIWLIGCHGNGGFLIGTDGGDYYHRATDYTVVEGAYPWMYYQLAAAPFADWGECYRARNGRTFLNGELQPTDPKGVLKREYQLLMNTAVNTTRAGGFCFNSFDPTTETSQYPTRIGGARLGQVVIYNRGLTDSERAQMDEYLMFKWLARPIGDKALKMPKSSARGSVDVSVGATLDLNGFTQTGASLSGAGTVANGDLNISERLMCEGASVGGNVTFAGSVLAFDPLAGAPVSVDGVFEMTSPQGEIHIQGDVGVEPGVYELVSAATVRIPAEGLSGWRTEGISGNKPYRAKLVADGNHLWCKISGGLTIIVR